MKLLENLSLILTILIPLIFVILLIIVLLKKRKTNKLKVTLLILAIVTFLFNFGVFKYIQNYNDKKEEANKQYESTKKDVMEELKKEFKPEFINRIDEIIVFHKLNEEDIMRIIEIMLNQVEKRLKNNNLDVEIDDSVKNLIFQKGFDKNYGARPLRRAIQNYVEDEISEAILDGKVVANKKAVIEVDENEKVVVG